MRIFLLAMLPICLFAQIVPPTQSGGAAGPPGPPSVPTATDVAKAIYCFDVSVTPNLITCTTTTAFAAYVNGQLLYVWVNNNQTAATTINVNGIGSKAVTTTGLLPLPSGTLVANGSYTLGYDGTRFQVVGGGGGGSGTVTNALALTSTAIVTGSGGVAVQTPCATCTLSSGGNLSIPGTFATGSTAPTLTAGDIGASRSNTTGAIYLGSDSNGYIFRNGPSSIVLPPTFTLTAALSGTSTALTQAQLDNSTKVSTTAYTDLAVANALAGVNPAVSVQAATATVLPNSPTYLNGVAGVGATLTTATTNTALVVDGYTMTLGDRVLVKNQASTFQNGVYFLSTLQGVAVAWILTRALDYDQPSDMNNTGLIPVVNGTANALTQWLQTSKVNTVGTDAVLFTQFGTGGGGSSDKQITMTFDGGGLPLTGTVPRCVPQLVAATIQSASLIADVSGSVTIDVQTVLQSAYTGPGSATTLTGSGVIPALASAIKAAPSITGWTALIPANSIVCFAMSAPTTVTWATLSLDVR